MRISSTLAALALMTSLAHAQAVSPLGGSTANAGTPPPVLANPTLPAPTSSAPTSPAPTSTPSASAPAAAPAHAARTHHTLAERFAAANTSHDGKLTLAQAKAGHMVAVTRDFSQIDKSNKGYVTLDEIKAHQADRRAARKAARDANKAGK